MPRPRPALGSPLSRDQLLHEITRVRSLIPDLPPRSEAYEDAHALLNDLLDALVGASRPEPLPHPREPDP